MLIFVIFDFDGVIVDSEPLHYRALQAVLAVTNSFDRVHLLQADAVTDSLEKISHQSLEEILFSGSRLT
jgi:beta-phosphoglucomutase-like phosphatase (HAD superfamily)